MEQSLSTISPLLNRKQSVCAEREHSSARPRGIQPRLAVCLRLVAGDAVVLAVLQFLPSERLGRLLTFRHRRPCAHGKRGV